MQTQYLDGLGQRRQAVNTAARLLREGGVVAIPTETVYGLAADALNPDAVERIFLAKGRPQDNPLIVHIADFADMQALVAAVDPRARALAEAFWPGPLSIVQPKAAIIPAAVSAGLSTVAIRMPAHPVAREIIAAAACPLAAPSANRSGRPSPTTAQHVLTDLNGRIDAVVDAGSCTVGVESTVISLAGEMPCLLRPGGVTLAQLEAVLGAVEVDPAVNAYVAQDAVVSSPGMKYQHYAPRAKVTLVHGSLEAFAAFAKQQPPDTVAMCFHGEEAALPIAALPYGKQNDPAGQAQQLFAALREADAQGAKFVLVRAPKREGVGLAVYNRLLRAAAFREVTL